MTRAKKGWLGVLGVAAASCLSPGFANVIPNGGFDTVGAYGNPVTVAAPGGPASAAAGWYTFLCAPGSSATSALVTSTDPHGGGLMLTFSTDGGFSGSCGNGLFAGLTSSLAVGSRGSFDINVPAGTTGEIGFVNSGGAFDSGSSAFGPTGGWTSISFSNHDSPTGEVGFEIFSAGGGSLMLDNGMAPVPEPGTGSLLAAALLLLLGWGWVARRSEGTLP
jgi:hypothetical protein